jgi:aminotransferase
VHNYIRFHFAKREETLDAAGEKLLEIRKRWAEDHA